MNATSPHRPPNQSPVPKPESPALNPTNPHRLPNQSINSQSPNLPIHSPAADCAGSQSLPPVVTDRYVAAVRPWLSDIVGFSRLVMGRPLRDYQAEPARAILDSILHGRGSTFAVMMSRQAGKNELSAQLEAYLLNLFCRGFQSSQIVKVSPTFNPQALISIQRLLDRLNNVWCRGRYRKSERHIVQLRHARCTFLSAAPNANVVGATTDILLEADEAQDIAASKWHKDFLPMGASTDVTTVLWGTAWTQDTLLARTIAYLQDQERRDGRRYVFKVDADCVSAELPAYATHVARQVQRLGRQHPLVKSQYYLEEIDAQSGLFPPQRQALMRGSHPRQHHPAEGQRYALLIDVAGEDEQAGGPLDRAMLANPRRDATALTVVSVTIPHRTAADHVESPNHGSTNPQLPNYRTVDRHLWLGIRHTALHDRILALARHWSAVWVIVDATGIGAGLASFLSKALGDSREGGRVIPITFSLKVKSDLGWDFLGIVETGRYADYLDDGEPNTRQFWHEVQRCQYQIQDGPGKTMRWGNPDAVAYDGLIAHGHDDLLFSAALCAVLDKQAWPSTGPSLVIHRPDELVEIDTAEW